MWNGSRHEGADYFDDVLSKEDAGVFQGGGVEDYEGIKEKMSPDGLVVTMNCRVCGKQHEVTLEWKELFICASNNPGMSLLKPQGWEYSPNNAKLYPAAVPCSKCGAALCPQITPDEARSRVNDAIQRGLVDMATAQVWKQQIDQIRAQRGG